MDSGNVLQARDMESYQRLLKSGNEYLVMIDDKEVEVLTDWIEFEMESPDGDTATVFEWALIPAQRGLPVAMWIVDATPSAEHPDWKLLIVNKRDYVKRYSVGVDQLIDVTGVDEKFFDIMSDMGW